MDVAHAILYFVWSIQLVYIVFLLYLGIDHFILKSLRIKKLDWKYIRRDPSNIADVDNSTKKMKEYVLNIDMANIRYIRCPSFKMQEKVCKKRPGLIGQINKLNPKLEAKYKDELNLAGIEI